MKKRFTEEQIIAFLREAEAGMPVKELCRRHGFSEASYYLWRSKFGGMSVPDAKRLKELETENARLKKLLAEHVLENEVTKQALRKSGERTGSARVGAAHAAAPPLHNRRWLPPRYERPRDPAATEPVGGCPLPCSPTDAPLARQRSPRPTLPCPHQCPLPS